MIETYCNTIVLHLKQNGAEVFAATVAMVTNEYPYCSLTACKHPYVGKAA